MKLAKYGKREWLGGGVIALLFILFGIGIARAGWLLTGGTIAVLALLVWLALAAFFRVPRRVIPSDPSLLLSPADGVVRDIETILDHGMAPFEGTEMVRVGIFLSVLDVHVNRAPCDLCVSYRNYVKGAFYDARSPRCIRENESLLIAGEGEVAGKSVPIAIRQVSGAIARRIVCDAQPGSCWDRGAIYGMIKFGSRTELFFPADAGISLLVKTGQTVRAGTTPLAQLKGHKN